MRHDDKFGAIDRIPKFQYAIYSRRDGNNFAELESSWGDEWQAKRALKQYQGWGFTDTHYVLVDWHTRTVISTGEAA